MNALDTRDRASYPRGINRRILYGPGVGRSVYLIKSTDSVPNTKQSAETETEKETEAETGILIMGQYSAFC